MDRDTHPRPVFPRRRKFNQPGGIARLQQITSLVVISEDHDEEEPWVRKVAAAVLLNAIEDAGRTKPTKHCSLTRIIEARQFLGGQFQNGWLRFWARNARISLETIAKFAKERGYEHDADAARVLLAAEGRAADCDSPDPGRPHLSGRSLPPSEGACAGDGAVAEAGRGGDDSAAGGGFGTGAHDDPPQTPGVAQAD